MFGIKSEKFISESYIIFTRVTQSFPNVLTLMLKCKTEPETTLHLFYHCPFSFVLWRDVEKFIQNRTGHVIAIAPKDIVTELNRSNRSLNHMANLILAIGKFNIHKARFSKSFPNINSFTVYVKQKKRTHIAVFR